MESEIDFRCSLNKEIQLIYFKCSTCRGCPFGLYIISEWEKWEQDEFHHKFETE